MYIYTYINFGTRGIFDHGFCRVKQLNQILKLQSDVYKKFTMNSHNLISYSRTVHRNLFDINDITVCTTIKPRHIRDTFLLFENHISIICLFFPLRTSLSNKWNYRCVSKSLATYNLKINLLCIFRNDLTSAVTISTRDLTKWVLAHVDRTSA
jgi:hypothetical protein